MTSYDAVILAGGASRRLASYGSDADKALVQIDGRTLLECALAATAGAGRVVVVGPRREVPGARTALWCREQPPGGGPVAAIGAGLAHSLAPVVVVLAVDHPFVNAATIHELVSAVGSHDGAIAVGADGRTQWLLAAHRRDRLAAAIDAFGDLAGGRVRDLLAPLDLARVSVGLAALDCDTPTDVAHARALAEGHRGGTRHDDTRGVDEGAGR